MKSAEQKAKNVPTIRFASFEDEWVNKIFGESFTYLQNNTLSRAELNSESGLAKNIHYGDVLVKFGECIDVAEEKIPFVSDAFVVDKFKNSFLQDGDIVIADTAEDETVGKCTEMQGVNDAILLSGLHTIPSRPKEKYGSKFLGYYLNSSAYHQQLLPLMQGVKVLSISKSALQETNLVIPKDNQEQQKIGSFFSNIDSLISLEQKKYDKLTQVKKSMLEKMFPKEGATVPEIRFAGFTGNWVVRNLKDICSIITKQTGFDYSETIKPSLFTKKTDDTYSFIQNKDFEGLNINLDTDFYIPVKIAEKFPKITLDQPSLLISISGRIGNVGLFSLDTKAFIGGAVGICKLNSVEDGKIALFELQSPIGQLYFKSLIKASSHANITVEDIRQIVVVIPKEETEKKKINQFFSHLDFLISLQQRKLEKLKNIKKSLLEKMFV